jgi:hypothetical protein
MSIIGAVLVLLLMAAIVFDVASEAMSRRSQEEQD